MDWRPSPCVLFIWGHAGLTGIHNSFSSPTTAVENSFPVLRKLIYNGSQEARTEKQEKTSETVSLLIGFSLQFRDERFFFLICSLWKYNFQIAGAAVFNLTTPDLPVNYLWISLMIKKQHNTHVTWTWRVVVPGLFSAFQLQPKKVMCIVMCQGIKNCCETC